MTPRSWTLVLVAVFLGSVEAVARLGWVSRFNLVPASEMIRAAGELLLDAEFLREQLAPTLSTAVLAFVVASIAGFAIGCLIWRFTWLEIALDPYLTIYYAVPTFALYPLLITVFGLGMVSIAAIGILFAIVAVIVNTVAGLRTVRPVLLKVARSFRLNTRQTFLRVYLPAAFPTIFTGIQLALVYAIIGVLASEFILSTRGLGHTIAQAYNGFKVLEMYGGIVLVFAITLGIDFALGRLAGAIMKGAHAERAGRGGMLNA